MSRRTLATFRAMAEAQGLYVHAPRRRWRGIVRAIAKAEGWAYVDSWLWVMYNEPAAVVYLPSIRGVTFGQP